MSKAYLIGGAPRIGKSSLTMKFLKKQSAYAASTDALTDVLRGVIAKETKPDLFHSSEGEAPQQAIESQIKESQIVWKSAVDFINRCIENGFDVVVEGLCVMPEFVSELKCDYSAVFLGNQSDEHFQTIKTHLKDNPNDWLNKHEDNVIDEICLFNQAYSGFIENEAIKFNMPYVEMKDETYESSMVEALQLLLN